MYAAHLDEWKEIVIYRLRLTDDAVVIAGKWK
jgi:hypothetical protein